MTAPRATLTPAAPPREEPVSLATIEADVRERVEDLVAKGRDILENRLPELQDLATKAEGNDLVDAALKAVHVSPKILTGLAATLNELEAELAKSDPAPAEAAPAEADAAVPDAQPVAAVAPDAPVVGGQAR